MNTLAEQTQIMLSDIEPGRAGLIKCMNLPLEIAKHLAGLGICEGRSIHIVKRGEPYIVSTYGSRVGIESSLVKQIQVSLAPTA